MPSQRATAFIPLIWVNSNPFPLDGDFYDDNLWLSIDFAELYHASHDKIYQKQAQEVWRFIESGTDDKLEGGVYLSFCAFAVKLKIKAFYKSGIQ